MLLAAGGGACPKRGCPQPTDAAVYGRMAREGMEKQGAPIRGQAMADGGQEDLLCGM